MGSEVLNAYMWPLTFDPCFLIPVLSLPACMIDVSLFYLYVCDVTAWPIPPISQHAFLRRVNANAARRHLDFTSREGEVDQCTVSVCDERESVCMSFGWPLTKHHSYVTAVFAVSFNVVMNRFIIIIISWDFKGWTTFLRRFRSKTHRKNDVLFNNNLMSNKDL